jgi:hypothetical protein
MQFGTNVLGVCIEACNLPQTSHSQSHAGHFYLTKLLLPVLAATAKSSPAGTVRVINVSSLGHNRAAPEGIRWTSVSPGNDSLEARKKLGTARLYGQSKLVKKMLPSVDSLSPIILNSLLLIGKHPVLRRSRSAIRRRRDCVHLVTPRSHQDGSCALFGFTRTAFRTDDGIPCVIWCNQFFVCWYGPCCRRAQRQSKYSHLQNWPMTLQLACIVS